MARLIVQLGGSVAVPIATPRRFPLDWRLRAFVEAGLTAPKRRAGSIIAMTGAAAARAHNRHPVARSAFVAEVVR